MSWFLEKHSIVAAPLADIVRNKGFALRPARKLPIPWGNKHETAFQAVKFNCDTCFPRHEHHV